MKKILKTIWDVITIFKVENIVTYAPARKRKKIYTFISTIVEVYIFACNYADKTLDPVDYWHKIQYYQGTER